ncbi:MAG: serine hydrolase [Clostridia bacterium]|nr:serine hydrolase [Clostridia bacterium]
MSLSSAERVIRAFADRLQKEDVNMHGFLLTCRGRDLAKAYYAPFREGQPHRMYSVSKTMTGLAIGMLAEEGKIRLNQPIVDFYPDFTPEHADERLRRQTVSDMLRMATCYQSTAYREGIDEDWTRPFFTGQPTHEPGTVFHYDTGASQVLANLVKRLSGQEVIDFLNDRLFGPLGCADPRYWLRDPSGCCQGGTGLCMSLRDLHKTALCLMDGGRGLVPEGYLKEMTLKHIDTLQRTAPEEQFGYGWQCWMTRAGWSMYGMGGQLVIVCPEQQAVLSTIADTRLDPEGVQRIYDAFFEIVYPQLNAMACDEPVELRLKVQGLPDESALGIPETPVYHFAPGNQLGLKILALRGDALIGENKKGPVRILFGRGDALLTEWPGWPGEPALIAGGWVNERLLRVRAFAVGDAPCGFDMLLFFGGEHLTVQSRRSWDPRTDDFDGVATGWKGAALQ